MIWQAVQVVPSWVDRLSLVLDLLPLIVAIGVAAVLYHLDGRYAKRKEIEAMQKDTASVEDVNGLGKRTAKLEKSCTAEREKLRDLQEHYRTQEERIETQRQYMERHIVRPIESVVKRLNSIGEKQIKTDAKLDEIARWMKD